MSCLSQKSVTVAKSTLVKYMTVVWQNKNAFLQPHSHWQNHHNGKTFYFIKSNGNKTWKN